MATVILLDNKVSKRITLNLCSEVKNKYLILPFRTTEGTKMEFAEGFFRSNFKIVILGDGGVVKTAIILNLLGQSFTKNY